MDSASGISGYSDDSPPINHLTPEDRLADYSSRLVLRAIKRIAQHRELPVFKGGARDDRDRNFENNAVMFQDYVKRVWKSTEKGMLALPPDVREVPGKWVTKPDRRSEERREVLIGLIDPGLKTHIMMTEGQPVQVFRISGQVDTIPQEEVTATDWLRLLVQEETRDKNASKAFKEALERIRLEPAETFTAAGQRLVRAVRATFAQTDTPHRSESDFFWRYAPIDILKELF